MTAGDHDTLADNPDVAGFDRPAWMSLFARSLFDDLDAACRQLPELPSWQWLRRPEVGAVMVRGRTGGNGRAFNLGEMTVTRCAVILDGGITGQAIVAGRARDHARLAALLDGLLQGPWLDVAARSRLLSPLAAKLAARRAQRAEEVAPTKVELFTMVRGED